MAVGNHGLLPRMGRGRGQVQAKDLLSPGRFVGDARGKLGLGTGRTVTMQLQLSERPAHVERPQCGSSETANVRMSPAREYARHCKFYMEINGLFFAQVRIAWMFRRKLNILSKNQQEHLSTRPA